MRIAYVSPLNPVRSGISDYSEELLPHLAEHAEIDLFVDGYVPTNPAIVARFPVHDVSELSPLRAARRYDACLYHLGNSVHHASAYRALQRFPGVTVLHDFSLHHLIVALTAARGDEAAYVREMAYSHGCVGIAAARAALAANHRFPYDAFPANRRVLDASLGLVVHSAYTRDLVLAAGIVAPVALIPHHATTPGSAADPADTRARLGLAPDEVVFGSFGLITPAKRLDVALRAFRRVRERVPRARYLIVGDAGGEADPRPLIDALGLADAVVCTGYVEIDRLRDDVAAVDVGINLRWPSAGETSGSLIRLLAAGKPTIVTDAGAFAELPDRFCPKVPVGAGEEERLAELMLELAADPARRRQLGEEARRYVLACHSREAVARRYVEFIEQVLAGPRYPRPAELAPAPVA